MLAIDQEKIVGTNKEKIERKKVSGKQDIPLISAIF
jgi:hypothetical protein